MSRVTRVDDTIKTVVWLCSACGAEHTVLSIAARPGADGAILRLDVPCGASIHVPFNDWSDRRLVPSVSAELANHVYYQRGDKSRNPGVRLIALDKTLGPPDPDTGGRPVVERGGNEGIGLAGELVPPQVDALTQALAKRDKDGQMVKATGR